MAAAESKSLEDLRRYSLELAARKVEDDPVVRRLRLAKQAAWLLLLTTLFLIFYLIDKMQEALSLL